MKEELQVLCGNFIKSRNALKAVFMWEDAALVGACASVFMNNGIVPDENHLKEADKLIKQNTGVFSGFRGNAKLPLVSMLAVSDRPEEKMKKIQALHQALKNQFYSSEYLVLVSAMLADMTEEGQYGWIAERGKSIYGKMKKEHPFLTSGEDSVFAVLLALSDRGEEQLVSDMEACYENLKKDFPAGNARQSLSHVLAFSKLEAAEKCGRVCEIYYGLKNAGVRYGTNYELATLGSLALLPADVEIIVNEMLEVNEFLGAQKGYGILGLDKKTRLLHASMIVSRLHSENSSGAEAAALTGTLSLVAAQQAAMCAVMATTIATASSSSNS